MTNTNQRQSRGIVTRFLADLKNGLPANNTRRRPERGSNAVQELELLESRQLLTIAFDFQYAGEIGSGVGFEDSTNGPARRAALEDVGRQFGAQFVNSATITVDVTSSEDPNSETLASAGSKLWDIGTEIFDDIEVVRHKILMSVDLNGMAADGTVDVNWGYDWQLSADPSDTVDPAFDFYSALLHELTHAVGFSSSVELNGDSSLGDTPGTESLWTKFDQFLTDVNETPIIDSSGVLDGTLWDVTIIGGTSPTSGLFFNGTNAKAANGGLPVGLFSPVVFSEGSSGSHLDDDNPAFAGSNMISTRDGGPGTRLFSAIEKGILLDLGYTLTAPGILVTETGGSTVVSETGTTDTFTVVLQNAPSANVVINVTSANTAEATVATSPLTFTSWNWNIPQTITVTGVSDSATDGNQTTAVSIQVDAVSSDASYGAILASSVSVTTTDNVQVELNAVATYPGSQPTLTWLPVADASRYEIWFSRIAPSATRLYSDTELTETSWTPPANLASGNYRYWVRAFDANDIAMTWSAANNFSVRPTIVSPVTPTFEKRPVFSWEAVPFATSYEFYLRTVNGDTTTPIASGTEYTPMADLPDGNIVWWIRAVAGAQKLPWSLPAQTNVQGRSTVLTPAAPTSNTNPTFTWQSVIGVGRYILVVQNSANEEVIREDNLTAATFTPMTALSTGTYRAWVKALDSSGLFSTGIWSTPFTFSITATSPEVEFLVDEPVDALALLNRPFKSAEVVEESATTQAARLAVDENDMATTEAATTFAIVRVSEQQPAAKTPMPGDFLETELPFLDAVMAQLPVTMT